MYAIALYLCLLLVLVLGLGLTLMTLPGLWLMLAATAVYAWLTSGWYVGWWTLATLLGLTVVAELIEVTSAGAGAHRAGAGRRGAWGALIGGIVGGIFLTIPLWIVGTLIGVCLGTFAGAIIGELSGGRELGRSAWIGVAAAKGRFTGAMIKLGFGCLFFVIVLVTGFPMGRRHLSGPGVRPATAPGTLHAASVSSTPASIAGCAV